MTDRPVVFVAGGGLAGITAACELADAGVRVKLIEKRPFLGGRSYSYEADGVEVDNGQHVFLGCCTAYIALLARLGVRAGVHLPPRSRAPLLATTRRDSGLQRAPLPPAARTLARARHGPAAGRAARNRARIRPSTPATAQPSR